LCLFEQQGRNHLGEHQQFVLQFVHGCDAVDDCGGVVDVDVALVVLGEHLVERTLSHVEALEGLLKVHEVESVEEFVVVLHDDAVLKLDRVQVIYDLLLNVLLYTHFNIAVDQRHFLAQIVQRLVFHEVWRKKEFIWAPHAVEQLEVQGAQLVAFVEQPHVDVCMGVLVLLGPVLADDDSVHQVEDEPNLLKGVNLFKVVHFLVVEAPDFAIFIEAD